MEGGLDASTDCWLELLRHNKFTCTSSKHCLLSSVRIVKWRNSTERPILPDQDQRLAGKVHEPFFGSLANRLSSCVKKPRGPKSLIFPYWKDILTRLVAGHLHN